MSAFLCSAEHIGTLAAYAAEHRLRLYYWSGAEPGASLLSIDAGDETPREGRVRLAAVLAHANLDSLRARYPDTDKPGRCAPEWGPYATDTEYALRCAQESHRLLRTRGPAFESGLTAAASIFNMARCYYYQSCEVERFDLTPAAQLVRGIEHAAACKLAEAQPGAVSWDYTESAARLARV